MSNNNTSMLLTALMLSALAAVLGSIPIILAKGIEWYYRLVYAACPNAAIWLMNPGA